MSKLELERAAMDEERIREVLGTCACADRPVDPVILVDLLLAVSGGGTDILPALAILSSEIIRMRYAGEPLPLHKYWKVTHETDSCWFFVTEEAARRAASILRQSQGGGSVKVHPPGRHASEGE